MNSNEPPLVSVMICAYNGEKYISQTIDSVLSQTYKNIEIVIVDDGSQDSTLKIVREYQLRDKRIVLYTQNHEGFAAARNKAFKEAKGEWIAIIDHDDLCYPSRIEKQLLLTKLYPDADFIFSNTDYIDENNNVIDSQFAHIKLNGQYLAKGKAAKMLLRKGGFIDSESVFVRKNIIETCGLMNTKYLYASDYDFFIRAGFNTNFCFTHEKLSAWRIHSNQATKKNNAKLNYEITNLLKSYLLDGRVDMITKIYLLMRIAKIYFKTIMQENVK